MLNFKYFNPQGFKLKSHLLDKPTLSAYTSPVTKSCASLRVHEAACFADRPQCKADLRAPSNALEWTGKVDFCWPQLLFHADKPTGSVFCFQIQLGQESGSRPRGLPLTTTHTHIHTRNLLDTLSAMSGLLSPQAPLPLQWLNLAQGTLSNVNY